ncbi:TetR/AcrR family transcriptional regulator [Amycolatopsis sp. BJA-103]|uniref:TetR/AcrR family transcriptional regulator n=1 Tax=unclassified Amycolatopsis TaxID=2618356 RepID=UPI000C765FB2|nr:TetR/AcrR family transcriptional regulator [Amycolatopsis sp. BJA-103]AUI57376.1 TetR family transcriptional regulator [Amycolatopsis sp. BJA-103]PNE13990.1 TetR family transcriptional regulator [Amycolatopsis sp. BJA-103]
MPEPVKGLRERKRLETHRALATTAVRLVAERGLDQVTVEDISAAAGVSSRTFFNYFASKEDAVVIAHADNAERSQRVIEKFLAAPKEVSIPRAFVAALKEDFAQIDENREEWLGRMKAIQENATLHSRAVAMNHDTIAPTIEAIARRAGVDPRDDLYPTLLLSTLGGAVNAVLILWSRHDGRVSALDLLDEAVEMLLAGLPEPGGRAR